ncbi:hypothetical protein [Streptomyces sp. DSM 40750]|uniref:hypothetical protein n=1 Tax=Streptomyces sp. DSM 40750 TaxID=2801030 RepID=UPI00214A9E3F|nr:hypothetical protein [Streptomyces sp. DSM 40750]UUU18881.1 hypothetical protein JIX55_00045 [Streptomyces sp. DSM 40750]UUU27777.1 hypothetical protein JIX55_50700 [Streptomyces sp. DSM 40750]
MSRRLPIDQAQERLRHELSAGQQPLSELDLDEMWLRFVRFGSQRFDTAGTPDADGLLFQYGTHSFEGPRVFTLDLARQFEVNDATGEHDHYIQLHCELRYEPVFQLRALGHFESWFFHDTDDELDRWADGLGLHQFWEILRNFHPTEIRVYQEQV